MRIGIAYSTTYTYAEPARAILQLLRVTPRPFDGQQVIRWRVDADADVRLRWSEDAFGNIVHSLQIERPTDRLTVSVRGDVASEDRAGIVRGAIERLPLEAYLRSTRLTAPDARVIDLARSVEPDGGASNLSRLHALLDAVADAVAFDTEATGVGITAAEALALGRGVCQDHAHVFISAAREMGFPARYISGHLMRPEQARTHAAHAWAEAHVEDYGWIGFDPANRQCPTDAYVRVAVGLDYQDAAPVRGARTGGGEERMTVSVQVQSQSQSQSQSQ